MRRHALVVERLACFLFDPDFECGVLDLSWSYSWLFGDVQVVIRGFLPATAKGKVSSGLLSYHSQSRRRKRTRLDVESSTPTAVDIAKVKESQTYKETR